MGVSPSLSFNLIWSSSSHLSLKMLRFTLLVLLQLGVAHLQNCPLSKTFNKCVEGSSGQRLFGSDPTYWDPNTVIEAGPDPHYDCRPCCSDESFCSIPQCDTGLIAPGCNEDQEPATPSPIQHDVPDVRTGPSYINEDLPSQVSRGRQTGRTQRPIQHEIGIDVRTGPSYINEDLHSQVSRGRQTGRAQRPSYNLYNLYTSNGALCDACKQAVNAIKRAKRNIRNEQARARRVNEILNNKLCYHVDQAEYRLCQDKGDQMRNLGAGANPTTVCINTQYCR